MWKQIIYLFLKPEKREDTARVFSFFIYALHLPLKHFKLFTWNGIYCIWIIMLMEFKLEIGATERRVKPMLLRVGCSWPWKCSVFNRSFCEAMLERTDSLIYSFKYLFSTYYALNIVQS